MITKAEGKIEGELALKAAHGLAVEYQYVGEFPAEAQKPETETGLQTLPYYAATQGTVPGWTFDGWSPMKPALLNGSITRPLPAT